MLASMSLPQLSFRLTPAGTFARPTLPDGIAVRWCAVRAEGEPQRNRIYQH
jgi:hypothetical protein